MSHRREDDLAYGDYHGGEHEESSERGFLGDVYHRLRGKDQADTQGPVSDWPVSAFPLS
jgi:phospholipase D1/2